MTEVQTNGRCARAVSGLSVVADRIARVQASGRRAVLLVKVDSDVDVSKPAVSGWGAALQQLLTDWGSEEVAQSLGLQDHARAVARSMRETNPKHGVYL